MPVNIRAGRRQQRALLTTVLLYALAMLAYACDFAFARQRLLAAARGGRSVARRTVAAPTGGGRRRADASAAVPADRPAAAARPADAAGAASGRWPGRWRRAR